jgi:Phage integrase family
VDELAELVEQLPDAATHLDSIARLGRKTAVTLLVATQWPTQEALGGGALRAQLTHNLRRVYQAAVAAAGEDLAHLDLRGPHDLRHTFATWLEDAGVPSRVIDELMGHAGGRRAGALAAARWAGLPGDDPSDARSRHGRAGRPDRLRDGSSWESAPRHQLIGRAWLDS